MTKAETTRKPQTARAQIRAHTKKIRAENAKAHEQRMASCTAAAEGTVLMDGSAAPVTKLPIGAKGLGRGGKAKPVEAAPAAPLNEEGCAKAADAWINAKEGRLSRYGLAEATSMVHDGLCTITTTNFGMIEVDAGTGKAKFIGWSPHKPQKLALTSRAKMGKAKAKPPVSPADPKIAENLLRASITRRVAGRDVDWSCLRTVDADDAQSYAEMLLAGCTPREAEQATGLVARDRMKVEKVLGAVGFKLRRERNPEPVAGDGMTLNRYRLITPA